MPAAAASRTAASAGEASRQSHPYMHAAWQVSMVLTLVFGLFHLINLVDGGRWELGPVLLTPFRTAFFLSWALLAADYILNRRRLRIDSTDALIAAVSAVFLFRGLFVAETFGIAVNWIMTGAGVFFLVKHGMRDRRDACLVIYSIVGAVLFICLVGLVEYAAKQNPLFDAIQVVAVGADTRIEASDQFYRVRSLIGHPGYLAAVLLASAPLMVIVFRRRRVVLLGVLVLLMGVIFLTFSRGTLFLTVVVALPLLFYYGRSWLRRNLKWVAPVLIIALAAITLDYLNREAVDVSFRDNQMNTEGLRLMEGMRDGRYEWQDGDGIRPLDNYLYFDVTDDFFSQEHDDDSENSPVTVTIRYFDRGLGSLSIDYDSNSGKEVDRNDIERVREVAYAKTVSINKTDTKFWTLASFYIENPGFSGRQRGADFRIVDEDRLTIVKDVSVQKGRLKLPSVVEQQWVSRWGSYRTRLDFFPFTWDLLREHPLGVGLYNTPGTEHHAIDSLPLTWMIEFGWPGLLLLAAIAWWAIADGLRTLRNSHGIVAALYLSLLLVLLHGAHLMIIYDKPTLVMTAAIGAVYAQVRPWRRNGANLESTNQGCCL